MPECPLIKFTLDFERIEVKSNMQEEKVFHEHNPK